MLIISSKLFYYFIFSIHFSRFFANSCFNNYKELFANDSFDSWDYFPLIKLALFLIIASNEIYPILFDDNSFHWNLWHTLKSEIDSFVCVNKLSLVRAASGWRHFSGFLNWWIYPRTEEIVETRRFANRLHRSRPVSIFWVMVRARRSFSREAPLFVH